MPTDHMALVCRVRPMLTFKIFIPKRSVFQGPNSMIKSTIEDDQGALQNC